MEEEFNKTVQEVSKLGTKALGTGDKLGGFLSRVFGAVPEDVVGLVGGDFLHHIRIRNAAKLQKRTDEILKERGIKNDTQPLSPNIALPLLNAAQNESREELQELWARMLANAMDPNLSSVVRQSIITAVQTFDPLDAKVLETSFKFTSKGVVNISASKVLESLGISWGEFETSLKNLDDLKCIKKYTKQGQPSMETTSGITITYFGREILRACSL